MPVLRQSIIRLPANAIVNEGLTQGQTSLRPWLVHLVFGVLGLVAWLQVSGLAESARAIHNPGERSHQPELWNCEMFVNGPESDVENLPQRIRQFRANQRVLGNQGDRYGRAMCFNAIGKGLYLLQRYDAAQQAHQRAFDLAEHLRHAARRSDRSELAWPIQQLQIAALKGMGDSSVALGHYGDAVERFEHAIRLDGQFHGNRYPTQYYVLATKLGYAHFQAGQLTAAAYQLQSAIERYERRRLRNRRTWISAVFGGYCHRSSEVESERCKARGFDQFVPAYGLLQRVLVRQGYPEAALAIAERGRARLLVDSLQEDLPEADPIMTVGEIRRIAAELQSTVIFYSKLSETQLYIWVIQPSGAITLRPVAITPVADSPEPPQSEFPISRVTPSIGRLFRAIQDRAIQLEPSGTDFAANTPTILHQDLQQMYGQLIAPIEDLLPDESGARLIVVPHQELFLVPFAALQNPDGQYLIQHYEISQSSSLQLLLDSQQRQNPVEMEQTENIGDSAQRPLIVSNPQPMPENLPPLPGAEAEARAIAAIHTNASLFPGQYATEETVKSLIENASVLHFATHGIYDEAQSTEGWVALTPSDSEDGKLTVREVFDLDLTANLVVLSACTTGRGYISGEGVLGLTRSFLRSGATTVVSSLWNVDDESTALLMIEFHRQWRSHGKTKTAALRSAMLTTMQQYPHPSAWAGFIMMGSPD